MADSQTQTPVPLSQSGFGPTPEGQRLQHRILSTEPDLPRTARDLYLALFELLRKAEADGFCLTKEHEYRKFLQFIPERETRTALVFGGGREPGGGKNRNFNREKTWDHFRRDDGAWFDFSITLRDTREGLKLLAYDFELRFPPQYVSPAWLRFDLNLPGHDNTLDGLRCHFHPGNDDLMAPSPLLSPLELLTLFLYGLRPRDPESPRH